MQKRIICLLSVLILLSSCKTLKETGNTIKKNLGIESNKENVEQKNTIEIIVACEESSDLDKYTNEGWNIVKEYSEEKVCSWKSIAASKDCDMEKDKGCKIIQPDKIGKETIYLLEK